MEEEKKMDVNVNDTNGEIRKPGEDQYVITNAKKDALSEMHSVAADAAKEAASKIIDVDADIKAVKSVVQKVDKAA